MIDLVNTILTSIAKKYPKKEHNKLLIGHYGRTNTIHQGFITKKTGIEKKKKEEI